MSDDTIVAMSGRDQFAGLANMPDAEIDTDDIPEADEADGPLHDAGTLPPLETW